MVATKYHIADIARLRERAAVTVGDWPFWILLAYVGVEFIRPQDLFSPLRLVRPALLLSVILTLYWMKTWGVREFVGDKLLTYLFLFTGIGVAWIPFALNNFWAFQASKTLVMLLVASSVPLSLMLIDRERRRQFFVFWMCISLYLAVYSLVNGGRGPGAFLEDQNDLALALCMGISFPYFLAQQRGLKLGPRLGYYALIAVILAGIVWTNSRGGFVGLICVAGYMFWLSQSKVKSLFVFLIFAVCALQFVPDSYVEGMRTIADTGDGSRTERLLSWRIGWEMFLANPIFGVGPQNWPFHAGFYQTGLADFVQGDKILAGRAAHSLWFSLIPEFGIIGSGLYFLMLFELFRRLRLSESRLTSWTDDGDAGAERDMLLAKAIRASIIGFLCSGTFLSVLYHPYIPYIVGFVIALSRDVEQRHSVWQPRQDAAVEPASGKKNTY